MVSKFTNVEIYQLIRFAGPLIGTLILISVYYVTLKTTNSKFAAIVAAFIYGSWPFNPLGEKTTRLAESNMARETLALSL